MVCTASFGQAIVAFLALNGMVVAQNQVEQVEARQLDAVAGLLGGAAGGKAGGAAGGALGGILGGAAGGKGQGTSRALPYSARTILTDDR